MWKIEIAPQPCGGGACFCWYLHIIDAHDDNAKESNANGNIVLPAELFL